MKIVLLAEPVSMSAPLKLSLKVTSIKLIPKFAQIVALVQMYARLKQFTPHSQIVQYR
jgi:hypothetical protein